MMKRAFDLLFGGALLCLTAPFGLLIAVLVKLNSPGPVFFRHTRIGRDGRPFACYKFRTMHTHVAEYARTPRDEWDPRITAFGRFLRNHGLDELPQLFNVARGDMGLVGPRPEMPFIVERYNVGQRRRLEVRPGMTGYWQLFGPHQEPIHAHMEFDRWYLRHRSFCVDCWLLCQTLPIMIRKRRGKHRPRIKPRRTFA